MNKKGPYFLIGGLVLAAVFIAGLQYGKQVEKTNKAITAILSVSPTKTDEPTKISYKKIEHKQCGVSFVYPSMNIVIKQSSSSAILENKKTQELISLNCEAGVSNQNNDNGSTGSAKIAGKEIVTNITNKKIIEFTVTNPKSAKKIRLVISKELLPLLEETLTFL